MKTAVTFAVNIHSNGKVLDFAQGTLQQESALLNRWQEATIPILLLLQESLESMS